ncbi:type II toxin-antitoxin system RelE family toxin [Paenibacillus aquistagni]|uniref:type II toxin-antitoxin system RelE family toxin n=1 Tax=Paenibacillus aquistagni TaxID=1852522 RepID=UPI0035223189
MEAGTRHSVPNDPSRLYRLRVGAYRVLFEIDHTELIVYIRAIDSRGGIYK